MSKKGKLIDVKDTCFDYFDKNFIAWEKDCFIDPWEKNEKFEWKNEEKSPPEAPGIYLFNSDKEFQHPYGKSGIYYIGKADSGLKKRLMGKLKADYPSQYDGKKYGKKDRYFNFNENVNHYYPYLNYYQVFQTKIHYKIIDKDKKYLIPHLEEILISAFFTKMGNRPPSNRTGPNQLIWIDTKISEKLKTVYDKLLSSKILD